MADDTAPPTDSDLRSLPLFPLPDMVLLPGAVVPLHIFEARYRKLMGDVLGGNRLFALPRLVPGFETEYEAKPSVFPICGVARVTEDTRLPDGRYNIVVTGVARVRILEELPSLPYRRARVERLVDGDATSSQELMAWHAQLAALCERLAPHLAESARNLRELVRQAPNASACADRVAAAVVADPDERQQLLEELDPGRRMALLADRLRELISAMQGVDSRRSLDLN